MMFRYLGWKEAADLIIRGWSGLSDSERVTYDFERLMSGATLLKTSRVRSGDGREHVRRER